MYLLQQRELCANTSFSLLFSFHHVKTEIDDSPFFPGKHTV